MSQFTLTPEEDALIVTALQYLSDVQTASHGGPSEDVAALLAKVKPAPVVAAEPAPVVAEGMAEDADPAAEEKPAKAKKAK